MYKFRKASIELKGTTWNAAIEKTRTKEKLTQR